jgi:hypothetical protein
VSALTLGLTIQAGLNKTGFFLTLLTCFMKFIITCLVSSFIFLHIAQAQNDPSPYTQLIKKAESLYDAKDYKASANTYSEAFRTNDWKGLPNDRYNAACSWALAGNADSAFFQLERLAAKSAYANYQHISTDSDLDGLHGDKRWGGLMTVVQQNKERLEANLNKPLVRELEVIQINDQRERMKLDSMGKLYGMQSPQVKELWKSIGIKDSLNLIKVKAILDKYGWLGPDEVGSMGALTLFLVIQHSDLATQQRYLPLMREAVKNKKAAGANLALLEDRVAVGEGRKQMYGSQLRTDPKTGKSTFFPIEDEANVNKRRTAIGLEPLEAYARRFGLEYHVPEK